MTNETLIENKENTTEIQAVETETTQVAPEVQVGDLEPNQDVKGGRLVLYT